MTLEDIEKRLAALEAVAPRCTVDGCNKVAREHLCVEHHAAWKAFLHKHRAEGAKFGGRGWQLVYFDWKRKTESNLKKAKQP